MSDESSLPSEEATRILVAVNDQLPGTSEAASRAWSWLSVLGGRLILDGIAWRGEHEPHIERIGIARLLRVPVPAALEERDAAFLRALSRQLAAERYDVVIALDAVSAAGAASHVSDAAWKLVVDGVPPPVGVAHAPDLILTSTPHEPPEALVAGLQTLVGDRIRVRSPDDIRHAPDESDPARVESTTTRTEVSPPAMPSSSARPAPVELSAPPPSRDAWTSETTIEAATRNAEPATSLDGVVGVVRGAMIATTDTGPRPISQPRILTLGDASEPRGKDPWGPDTAVDLAPPAPDSSPQSDPIKPPRRP